MSTGAQSSEPQMHALTTHAVARGWAMHGFVDDGISGAKDRRPALDLLMKAARARDIDGRRGKGRHRTGKGARQAARPQEHTRARRASCRITRRGAFDRKNRREARCKPGNHTSASSRSAADMSRRSGHITGTDVSEDGESARQRNRTADSQSAASARNRRLLTLKEAADYLALSTWTVRELVWKGRLPAVPLTRRLHFDRRDLDRLIDHAKDRI